MDTYNIYNNNCYSRSKKIPQLARSFGKATSEFEKARIQSKSELEKIRNEDKLSHEKLESIADTLRIDYDGKR